MGQKSNCKIKPVYFNLDDEDEKELYEKASKIKNFSRWVKKQINGNDKVAYDIQKEEVKRVHIEDNEVVKENAKDAIVNNEISSMMI